MVASTLKPEQLGADFRALGRRLRAALMRGAYRGALRAVLTLQRATNEAKAVHTGQYKRAWKAQRTPTGARVYNAAAYADIIEYGRRAGARQPPSEVIARWAQRKLGLKKKDAKRAGFLIARAIGRRGLKPRRVMTNQVPNILADFQTEIAKELYAALVKKEAP
jgi:hypothetical protein